MIYFTSDLHFNHANVIKHCNRPFNDVEHMNESLIENWNSVVKEKDSIYILGDFCLKGNPFYFLDRLQGRKYLIFGNHDKKYRARYRDSGFFDWCKDYFELQISGDHFLRGKKLIVFCHYAMRVWNKSHYGSWHLYGHSHGSLKSHGLSLDVGVDCWDHKPVSLEQIEQKMETLDPVAVDHHEVKVMGS